MLILAWSLCAATIGPVSVGVCRAAPCEGPDAPESIFRDADSPETALHSLETLIQGGSLPKTCLRDALIFKARCEVELEYPARAESSFCAVLEQDPDWRPDPRTFTPGDRAAFSAALSRCGNERPAMAILGFSPDRGKPGQKVWIRGVGLAKVEHVHFGLADAPADAGGTDTLITAIVPRLAATGPVEVSGVGRSASSEASFVVRASRGKLPAVIACMGVAAALGILTVLKHRAQHQDPPETTLPPFPPPPDGVGHSR